MILKWFSSDSWKLKTTIQSEALNPFFNIFSSIQNINSIQLGGISTFCPLGYFGLRNVTSTWGIITFWAQNKDTTTRFSRHEQVCVIRLRFERYFSHHRVRWWEKYLSKRSVIRHTCSWRDKLIVLWIMNRQTKIFLRIQNKDIWTYQIFMSQTVLIFPNFIRKRIQTFWPAGNSKF